MADFPSCLRRLQCYAYASLSWTSAFPLDQISLTPTLSACKATPVHSQVLTAPARELFHVDSPSGSAAKQRSDFSPPPPPPGGLAFSAGPMT